eukprot:15078169-Ditylum_brightwellii.AAC.1
MEIFIKKSVADEIAHILPGMISATLKELSVTKPIASNINTSTSITPSTITEEGNITPMPKESPAKDISSDNIKTTATADKSDETKEISAPAQQPKILMLLQKQHCFNKENQYAMQRKAFILMQILMTLGK